MHAQPRTILHVDMDAFYVSVEVLLDPSLRGKPVIVGGDGARGVVASCSYEARAYGVRSAMASVTARRLCPNAIFLRGRHGLYAEYSSRIHEVFRSFTPLVEGIALDEAFLDVTGTRRLHGDGPTVAAAVREKVRRETGLTCSVGVGPSKLLAKLASKQAKPPIGGGRLPSVPGAARTSEGVLVVDAGDGLAYLHPQPVRALWGVGPKTFERLARFGVQTVGDLSAMPVDTLVRALGRAQGVHLHELASGRDERAVEPQRPVKSIGHEETFAEDHHDTVTLSRELLRMSDAVAQRARGAGVRGRTVQLKLKLSDFRTLTRSRTVDDPIDTAPALHATAKALLEEPSLVSTIATLGVRLLGVSLANLVEPSDEVAQLDLFAEVPSGTPSGTPSTGTTAATSPSDGVSGASGTGSAVDDRRLAGALDAIRERFGDAAVGPAALSERGRLRVKQRGDTQWGPSAPEPEGGG